MTSRPGRLAAALALAVALLAVSLVPSAPPARAASHGTAGATVRVWGNVTDVLLGTRIAGAMVKIGTGQSTTSGPSGLFVFQLPSGVTYRITTSAANFHTDTRLFTVPSGIPTDEPIGLQPYEYSFTGAVTNWSSGDPIPDAYVILSPGNLATTTAPDGSFRLALENGSYNATVSAVDFETLTWAVFVAGQAVDHEFPLNSSLVCFGCPIPPTTGGGGGASGGFLGLNSAASFGLVVVILAALLGVLGTTAYFVWRTRIKSRQAGKSLFALPFAAEDPGAPAPTEADRRRAAHHRRR